MNTKRQTFQSPYNQYKMHKGKSFEIIKELPQTDDEKSEGITPLHEIKFETGETISAWPEEIFSGLGWEPVTK